MRVTACGRKGCPEVAKRKAPDPLVQVRDSKTLDFNYSHSLAIFDDEGDWS